MVYYIRFLKPPIAQQQKKAVFISALICITTDLGDDFLAEDIDLMASWVHQKSRKPICEMPLTWEAGSRQLSVSLGPYTRDDAVQHPSVLIVRPRDTQQDRLEVNTIPLVISACSAPFQSEPAEKLIERNFNVGNEASSLFLKIWEETGNSIARHIW